MNTYKIITRIYYTGENGIFEKGKIGRFIARGQWADGHLAYSRLDDEGNEIEGEECAYYQRRGVIKHKPCLYMERI